MFLRLKGDETSGHVPQAVVDWEDSIQSLPNLVVFTFTPYINPSPAAEVTFRKNTETGNNRTLGETGGFRKPRPLLTPVTE
jgi:hypothetical protein